MLQVRSQYLSIRVLLDRQKSHIAGTRERLSSVFYYLCPLLDSRSSLPILSSGIFGWVDAFLFRGIGQVTYCCVVSNPTRDVRARGY
jgi:hypothetical protein